ncbi:MAG: tetratricopeptide repeat protein [Desulfobacterota bacterium]|jgi:tetratricopeptide (TPR) repeat protein|nr:tetratricopeptide repeat protein [Thermodesulfobacteriota bacterium]
MKKKPFKLLFCSAFFVFSLAIHCTALEVCAQSSDRLIKEGIAMMEKGDYASARDRFQTAARMNDSDYIAHYLLGRSLFHLKEYDSSEKELLRTIQLQPTRHPLAYVYLGNIAFQRNDPQKAKEYWEQAYKLDPSIPGLEQKLARADHDTKVERRFIRHDSVHFAVKYEGAERYEAGAIVLDILEDAYREVGRDLGHYPLDKVQTILYSNEQFREIPGIPGWSGAVYDGKIRLGIGGVTSPTPALRAVLFHEYTHAVIRDITPRCPAWLHEGLAQYFEGRKTPPEIRSDKSHKGPILTNLEFPFRNLNTQQAKMAYIISLSAVEFMIDRYGMLRVRNLLQDLAKHPDTAAAIDNALYVSYEQFERDWRKSIE